MPAATRNSSRSGSDVERPAPKPSPRKISPTKLVSQRKSDGAVRFRNTLIISEYKEKNPHISIQQLDEPSQFDAEDLSSDDEVWIFQAPASMDVSKLTGEQFKLGSRNSVVQAGGDSIECVTEKFAEPKTMTMICPQRNAQMSLVSFVPEGRVLLRSAINIENEDPIDFDGLETKVKVPFPDNLKVRHPIHGANYEKQIKLDKEITARLAEADNASAAKPKSKKIKQEIAVQQASGDDIPSGIETSPKKKSRKRKLEAVDGDEEEVPFLPKRVKTKIETEDGNDLDWIKQL